MWFQKGRSTVDKIFVLREIQVESEARRKPTILLFVDFKRIYDGIREEELFRSLEQMRVSNKYE